MSACDTSASMVNELELRSKTVFDVGQHLILGCSPLAGIYTSVPEEQALETVQTALELGFVDFDTAPHYGLGLSESRLGHAVSKHADGRPVRLWSKVGRVLKRSNDVTADEGSRVERGNIPGHIDCIFPDSPTGISPVLDYTGQGVRRSIEDSLRRMNVTAVYGLRVHDAEDEFRFTEAMAPGGGIDALVELRERGEIRSVSLGMNDAKFVTRMIKGKPEGTFDSIMSAGAWNLIDQDGLDLLLDCQRLGIKVHNAGIFASGLLVGGNHYKYAPAPPEIIERREQWLALSEKHGMPLPAVAIAFALLPTVVEKAAIGVKSPDEVRMNVEWLQAASRVPSELWVEAQSMGLLPENIPVPI